ncbi:YcxB family protein [Rhizobium sp. XQZ8]|uniref:YcxB family protein n=1 Tax=Rhizobium populisoli TaxID=2859785 RepID=UPI001C668471|nr:YcxB family protein [Rhizobium populisoli]MBW6423176.1 YcxB family protein [Rhizobium populisoli]
MIRYSLTEADIIAGNDMWRRHQLKPHKLIIFMLVAWAIAGIYFHALFEQPAWLAAISGLAVILAIVLALMWMTKRLSRGKTLQYFREAANSRQEISADWDETHIWLKQEDGYVKMPWSDIKAWTEDETVLTLLRNSPIFYAIPKRALDAQALNNLRICLTKAGVPAARYHPF